MGLFGKKDETPETEEELAEELKEEVTEEVPEDTASELEKELEEQAEELKEEGEKGEAPKPKITPDNITDDQLDEVADCGIEVLQSILGCYNLGDVTIDEYEGDDRELILDVTGKDLSILIGYHGRTLDALQTVVSIVVSKKLGFRYPIFVDVEGYKNRRRQKVEKMANSLAQKAIRLGKPVSMRPASAYERRIVHVALKDNTEVETHSEGEGRNRHLVITPISNE
ncbi:MAG: KH domain-containing protein [Enterococcus sp.]|nr:KH domain-containing protein [Enterococcus sp.]